MVLGPLARHLKPWFGPRLYRFLNPLLFRLRPLPSGFATDPQIVLNRGCLMFNVL
jgi:hypothetical protein